MKKTIIFLLTLTILTAFSACADSANQTIQTSTSDEILTENPTTADPSAPTDPNVPIEPTEPGTDNQVTEPDTATQPPNNIPSDNTFVLSKKGENYELYRHSDGFKTYYKIYDNNGILLDVGYDTKDIGITQDGNIVQASYNWGTCNRGVKYYDVEIGRASIMIGNPLALNGDLVAITSVVGEDHCLVVRHIFDPKVYYKAIVLDPKPDSAVQFEAAFTDAQHVQLTYSTAEGMVTKTFSIDETTENQIETNWDNNTRYTDAELSEISEFSGTKEDILSQYPTDYIQTIPIENIDNASDVQDSYQVIYRGETKILLYLFDASGNKISSQFYNTQLAKKSFDSLSQGQTLSDVQIIDPNGEYLFLYTGRNDLPRVSSHYTTDGFIIIISYDNNNIITSIYVDTM